MLRVKEITQKYEKGSQYCKTGQTVKISQAAHAKISQPAKSSHHYKIFCNAHSPSVFSSNFHLLCSCSFELGLGSSHLNWLEDSGTIGLQNYKNIHKI